MAAFPTAEWLQALMEKLNTDEKYAQVARNWEGDMGFLIEPSDTLKEPIHFYLDLWHGKCREAHVVSGESEKKPAFLLKGTYTNYQRLLNGEIEPMQALLTRKVGVQGNMAVLMRSVPVVLDFVRCCRAVTDRFV